ncbi:hypothetical protein ACFC1T_17770 [Kitasatospora sp. NPDC056076]|uniref:hypothetical protein n=1 Tax=Kitasatospora sp. NPDC056076 TaxID=3345703 RepID=UPI0035E253ED
MLDSPLTADVPLGPFQDAPVTVRSARSKNAQLRTRDITTFQVPLNAGMIDRMCSRCAEPGHWASPASGLGIFLRALGGLGLLHQLQQYTAPDPDDCWEQDELQAAAALLRTEPVEPAAAASEDDEEPDEEDWEARDEAKRLWESVLSTWAWRGHEPPLRPASPCSPGWRTGQSRSSPRSSSTWRSYGLRPRCSSAPTGSGRGRPLTPRCTT